MAVKSNIEIAVDDAAFLAFKEKFDKYADALDEVPEAWFKIGKSSETAKTNFEAVALSMKVVGSTFASITESGKEFYHVTTSTARHWKDLAISTASVAKNIINATESLLKWTGIVSLVTGGAGLWGFDRLTHSVAEQRTAALGVGTSYGGRTAFTTAFERMGDPEGLLGKISQAQAGDSEQRRNLYAILSEQEQKGESTDVAIRAIRKMARIAQTIPEGLLDKTPFLAMLTHEQRMFMRKHPDEIESQARLFEDPEYRRKFEVSEKDQLAYANLRTQLSKASSQIEKIFVTGLVKLTDPLEKLSQALIDLVDKFMKSGGVKVFLDKLSKGIEWLAKTVDDPETGKKIDKFLGAVGELAVSIAGFVKKLASWAQWLGIAPANASTGALGGFTSSQAEEEGGHGMSRRSKFGHMGGGTFSGGGGSAAPISGEEKKRNAQESWNFWKSHGYSDDAASALMAMERGESDFDPGAFGDPNKPGGSKGSFQWDAKRRADILRGTGINVESASHADELKAADWEMQHGDLGAQRFHRRLLDPHETVEGLVGSGIHDFERSAAQQRDYNRRLPFARSAKEQFAAPQKQKVVISNSPGGNSVNASLAASAGSP